MPLLVWKTFTREKGKNAIAQARYNVIEDIDYYRKKFTGLSPATISMLMDLKIEQHKDATAAILKYVMMGVVSMQGDRLTLLNPHHPRLTPSDHILLSEIARGPITPQGIQQWSTLAYQESLRSGYFTQVSDGTMNIRSSGCLPSCLMGCLGPFIIALAIMFVMDNIFDMAAFDSFLDAAPDGMTNEQQLAYIMNSDYVPTVGFLLVGLPALIGALVLPIVALVRMFVLSGKGPTIQRTEQGEIVAERIADMKNFICDFSLLSQAEKNGSSYGTTS